jgi:hypothetical protein
LLVLAGYFFQWQEAVALCSKINKSGFEALFDSSDFGFVDAGFFLLYERFSISKS